MTDLADNPHHAAPASGAETSASLAPAPGGEVRLLVTLTAKREQRQALFARLDVARQTLPTVPGCLGAILLAAVGDEPVFTLLEHWTSRSAHEAHIARMTESGDWAALAALLASEPESRYYVERV